MGEEVPDGPWEEVDDGHGTVWRVERDFLASTWTCTWGRGCEGILEEPAAELQQGCCSVGAELLDEDEAALISALAATLAPERFQFHGAAAEHGVLRAGATPATRIEDGACIFLNRPGFAGGAGCALHLGALDDGESPLDWKPSVCWQLPLKVERAPLPDGREQATLRRWRREDWGDGARLHWCCTTDAGAFVGDASVVESLGDELRALVGEEVHVELRRRIGPTMREVAERAEVPGRSEPLADDRFRAALDAMQDHVAIGAALRDEDGRIVDFELLFLNAATVDGAGRPGSELVGGRVLELFPDWAAHGLFDEFCRVVETGEPFVADRVRYEGEAPDGRPIHGWWSISAVRFGDGYLTSTRDITRQVEAEEERLRSELDAARHRQAVELLQRAALPTVLPQMPGIELGARYEPAARAQPVGGDWYDAFALGSGRLGLVIADVAGHGPDAAAAMVQVRNVVRALAFEHEGPAEVLGRADAVLARMVEHDLYATCCYVLVDPAERTATWARAGHLPPVLLAPEAAPIDSPGGPPLGVAPGPPFPVTARSFDAGTGLVLFTDGLVEVRGASLADGLARVATQVASRADRHPQEVADALVAAVSEPGDDLAVLVARFT